jgi:hypothetical protein
MNSSYSKHDDDDRSRILVFDMLVERLTSIEQLVSLHIAACSHEREAAAKGTKHSATRFADREVPVLLLKCYDSDPDFPPHVILTGHAEGFFEDDALPYLTDDDWMAGADGPFDEVLRAAWGSDKYEQIRTSCAEFVRRPQQGACAKCLDVSLTGKDGWPVNEYLTDEIVNVVLQNKTNAVFFTPSACILRVGTRGPLHAAAEFLAMLPLVLRTRNFIAADQPSRKTSAVHLPTCVEVRRLVSHLPLTASLLCKDKSAATQVRCHPRSISELAMPSAGLPSTRDTTSPWMSSTTHSSSKRSSTTWVFTWNSMVSQLVLMSTRRRTRRGRHFT